MFVRDSGRSGRISLGKSRMLNQPRRRYFAVHLERRVARDFKSFRFGARRQLFELLSPEDRVLEKRSRATAIFVVGDDQHAFTSPYFANRRSGFGERRRRPRSGVSSEMLLQIGVLQIPSAPALQAVVHPQDNVSATF